MAKFTKKTNTKTTNQSPYRVALIKNPQTSTFYYLLKAPTVEGKKLKLIFTRGSASRIPSFYDELMRKGALFVDPKIAEKEIGALIAEADAKGVKGEHVTRNGWHGDTFVQSSSEISMLRMGKGRKWLCVQPPQTPTYLGASKGDLQSWQQEVALPAKASSLAMYGIAVALAAPLARHAGLSEGMIFNIAGLSSTGKTTVAKVAASVSGNPEKIPDWNFTDTAVEEQAAAYSDHLMILDDTERTRENLARRLKPITHVLVGGQSRKRSNIVSDSLPQNDWFLVMLMTSPEPVVELVKAGGLQHTLGEKVRLVDLLVPTDCNGVFDRLDADTKAAQQADLLQQGMSQNFGVLFEPWTKELPRLRKTVKAALDERVERQETKAKRSLEGHERRIMRKLLLPLIAANEARKADLLPWESKDITAMNRNVVEPALKYFRRSMNPAQQDWIDFADRLQHRDGLFDLRSDGVLERPLRTEPADQADIGVLLQDKAGADIVGLTQCWIRRLTTARHSPIIAQARKQSGKSTATATQLAEQRRLKLAAGGADRTRLVYLPVKTVEELVRANASDGYERWVFNA